MKNWFTLLKKYSIASSPHYYYGRSVPKLIIHNIIQKFEFFRRRGPSRKLLSATKQLHDSKIGKSALILGSGPSLDKLNIAVANLEFDDIFVVNNYYLHTIGETLTPTYYCLSDPNYFVTDKSNAIHQDNELFGYMERNNITLLLSHFYRKLDLQNRVKTLFFDDREWRGLGDNISPLKPRSYGSFTLYKAIAMACYFGYTDIYILGLDNTEFKSYIGSIDNKIYVNNKTHYARSSTGLTLNVNPEGFTSGMAGRMQSYALQFGDLLKFHNHNIINLDADSIVDVFPKISSHPAIRTSGVQ